MNSLHTSIWRRICVAALLAVLPTLVYAVDPLGLPEATPESVGMSAERLGRIVPAMASFVEDEQVPGLITVVARRGKVVHFETYGSMDREAKKPMRPDTIFRMYSMTKPVTGTAIMILYEEGKIALTDPISKYLPEFTDMRVYVGKKGGEVVTKPANKPITITHLLTHTSGITYDFWPHPVGTIYKNAGLDIVSAYQNELDLEAYVKLLAEQPLFGQPGEQWEYGLNMDVLGRLVEVVTGQRFGDFMEERIFGPLGMVDAGFHISDDQLDRFAANYAPSPEGRMFLIDPPKLSLYRQDISLHLGGAGLVCTAADYLRFAQMLANGGELDGVRILSPTTVDLMMSNHLPPALGDSPLGVLFPGARGLGFGFCGSVVTDAAAMGMAGSKGEYSWGGAASTDFWIDREQELVGMVLTQLLPAGTYPTRARMHQMTYQAITD